MAREKAYYAEVLADLQKKTSKTILGINDIKQLLRIGYDKAFEFLNGQKTITIYQLASRLLD